MTPVEPESVIKPGDGKQADAVERLARLACAAQGPGECRRLCEGCRHIGLASLAALRLSTSDAAALMTGDKAPMPKEPTEGMTRAGEQALDDYFDNTKDAPFEGSLEAIYRAMFAAHEKDFQP